MGILDRFKLLKKAATVEPETSNYWRGRQGWVASGVPLINSRVNDKTLIKKGFESNADVFAVTDYISKKGASVPLYVERLVDGAWRRDETHPLQDVINKPSEYETGREHRRRMFNFFLITGNLLEHTPKLKAGANAGQFRRMLPIPPQDTKIISGGWAQPIKSYRMEINAGESRDFDQEEVLHMRTTSLTFGHGAEHWGMSPLTAGLRSLNRSDANYNVGESMMRNGSPAGIIVDKTEVAPQASGQWGTERAEAEQEHWNENHMGEFKAGSIYMTDRELDFIKMGISAADLQLMEDKRATLRDFCSIYGIDSMLFNDQGASTHSNKMEAKKNAVTDVVQPLVDQYSEKLTHHVQRLWNDKTIRVKPDYSSLPELQKDFKAQVEAAVSAVRGSILTPNEARESIGYDAVEDEQMNEIHTPPQPGQNPLDGLTGGETEQQSKMLDEWLKDNK